MKIKLSTVLSIFLLSFPVLCSAEQYQVSDWTAESHTGKLGQINSRVIKTPTVQGPDHVFLQYDCARFIPMLTASKGVTFPHGGATECSSNGCVAIQFANAKLDSSPVTGMMMFVDPLRPDKVSFHLPFGRSKLESASSLKIEMYTGNPMMGDRNSDLYEFSLIGFTKASEWCRSGRHPASSLKSGGKSPASGG